MSSTRQVWIENLYILNLSTKKAMMIAWILSQPLLFIYFQTHYLLFLKQLTNFDDSIHINN